MFQLVAWQQLRVIKVVWEITPCKNGCHFSTWFFGCIKQTRCNMFIYDAGRWISFFLNLVVSH